jgi:2-oxoglutarate ferredoxin oxidoreductase subunit beta
VGKRSKSTPYGSLDRPFNPLSLALGVEATFVARSVDIFQPHLKDVLKRAAAHGGSAFIEVLQNCNIFNDGAWEGLTDKGLRDDHTIALEHGKPLVFGKSRDKGIRRKGLELEVVALGDDVGEEDLLVHDEHNPNPAYAFLLSRMDAEPDFPTPIGVLRSVDAPRYELESAEQVRRVTEKKGPGELGALLHAGDTWEVR